MYLKDRIPTYPNRKKITFEDDGSIRFATIEYADDPLEEGTPMNASSLDAIVPNGVILMWSGNSDDIPDGWALCDGNNGTPDLRGRFIIGSGNEYPNKSVGGSATIDLTHIHEYSGETEQTKSTTRDRPGEYGSFQDIPQERHTHGYSGKTEKAGNSKQNILPPYYALCYIMKITQIAKQI